jgi:thioredoxin 1
MRWTPPWPASLPDEVALTAQGAIHSFVVRFGVTPPSQTTTRYILMAVGKVSDADFDSEVLKATGPVVVDFWAPWCGPCKQIAPALEEIAGSLGSKVKIVKLNVDENPKTATSYGIMSIPTLMVFKDGKEASRQVGAAPKQKLEQWITASA